MREIEVKLKARSLDAVAEELSRRGCVLSAPVTQHDIIYSKEGSVSEWEASQEGHVVMRIRRQDGKAQFNLKQQRSSEDDNLEFETEVSDPEAAHSILKVLGYAPQVEVKKERRKGVFEGYEICLDRVEGLGDYVELEKMCPEDADPEAVQEELLLALESLGLSRADREVKGYDTQLFHLGKRLG